jgi:hypothetical protein
MLSAPWIVRREGDLGAALASGTGLAELFSYVNVSSAIAGEQVMPRPPGPVTRITPGSTSARWYSAWPDTSGV